MNDYFFEYTDARAELAGAKVVIENLLMAIEKSDNEILLRAAINCAKDGLKDIEGVLNR